MKEEKLNVSKVMIYGQPYQIKGDASSSHLQEVARWVDQKMQEIGERNPRLDHAKIAVLAALNIADELLRVRKELEELYRLIDEMTSQPSGKEKSG